MRRQIEVDDDEPYVVIEKHQGSVGSLLLGVAVGAGLALLFAPRSGAETRRAIGDQARRVKAGAEDMVEDASDRVTDTFQQARARVEERLDSARTAIEMKKQQVARAMDAGRYAAQQAREDLERRIAETKQAYRAGTQPGTAGARARAANAAGTAGRPPRPAGGKAGTPGGAGGSTARVAEDAEDTE